MRHPRRALAAAALVAAVFAASPAGAQPVPGLAFEPPYRGGAWFATSGIGSDCAQSASRWNGFTARPDATKGRLDLSIGLAASGCRSFLDEQWFNSWQLGEPASLLVGRPARVTLEITVEKVSFAVTGSGTRIAAFSVAAGDARPAADDYREVARAKCSASACATKGPRAGKLTVVFDLERLPERLHLGMRRSAVVRATSEVGILMRATLDRVRVEPLPLAH